MAYRGTRQDMTDEEIRKLLKSTKDQLGTNSTKMAKWLNIPYTTYSAWESGLIRIRHKTILRLALLMLTVMHGGDNEEGDGDF